MNDDELGVVDGPVAPELREEFPGLRVPQVVVEGLVGRTPRALRERLNDVTSRFRGASAIALRTRPVPHAYRVFYRHIGLDPDVDRTPVEEAAVARLVHGEFCTGDRVIDALALAVIETGVPVSCFGEDALAGPVGLRAARAGETLPAGEYAHDLVPGRLVLADDAGPVAVLFGRMSDRHAPRPAGRRLRLVAVQVPGVPDAHVAEALWLASSALSD